MGRFISNFQTTAELISFSGTSEFGRPHVSLTKDNSVVHYFTSGIVPEYRWVDDEGYTCVDYDKYTKKKQQMSLDGGTTWTDTGAVSAGTLIEENSEDCGYEPPKDTRVICKYNVTDTENETVLFKAESGSGSGSGDGEGMPFSLMEIDGVEMEAATSYTFDSTGEHIVKYTLVDPTSIGNEVFRYCHSLTSIDIPNSVTSIGTNAFDNCSSLTSCTIGSGVTSISTQAFAGCTSLTSIVIPDSVTTIDSEAFYGCSSLTSIDIPDSVTSIGESAFNYCSSLTSIDIPNSVTSIGNSAFADCSGLTSCTIGSGVTSIGEYAFGNCSGLTSITCNATTAPTISSNTFSYVKTGGTLTVPIGSSGYDVWMGTGNYYLGKYNWTKVEQ